MVWFVDVIDEGELCEQFDYVCMLCFFKKEMIWLVGNMFYGCKQIFLLDFLQWLIDFCLLEYQLEKCDGQYEFIFFGLWVEMIMWEILVFVIINEL